MLGRYEIRIYNKRVHYHFTIKRNITVIQGDSATGKTELVRMIADYENNKESSGITLLCSRPCVVIEYAFWKEKIASLSQCICFIDEGAAFLQSNGFAEAIKHSDNYFVLVTRDSLEQLPYSIEEIYGMRQERESQKYKGAKRVYNELYPLYNVKADQRLLPDVVLTEDSNAGYMFFKDVFGEICETAGGKSNILSRLLKTQEQELLAIVDGAAFGPEMAGVMRYIRDTDKRIVLYAPESFEYLLLKADIIGHTSPVTEETYSYADSRRYFSWEEFYTDYLVRQSAHTVYPYSKKRLDTAYLTTKVKRKILEQLPEKVRERIDRR